MRTRITVPVTIAFSSLQNHEQFNHRMGGAGARAACAAGQAAIAGQRPGTHEKYQLSHWAGEPHPQKQGDFGTKALRFFMGCAILLSV